MARDTPWVSLLIPAVLALWLGSPWEWTRSFTPAQALVVVPGGPGGADFTFTFERVPLVRRAEGGAPRMGEVFRGTEAVELGVPRPARLTRIALQTSHDAELRVSTSRDGRHYEPWWIAPPRVAPGLRARTSPRLPPREGVRLVRIESLRDAPWALTDVVLTDARPLLGAGWLAALLPAAWLGLTLAARTRRSSSRLARLRAGWRAWDAPLAALAAGLFVPGLRAPCVGAVAVFALARALAESGAPERERVLSRGCFAALLAVALLHFALVTYGTGELSSGALLGVAYDALGDSLLAGDSTVPGWAIRWEAFLVDGRSVMYFGPLPALLRILPNALWPEHYGLWSRASCGAASLLSLFALLLVLSAALRANPSLSAASRRALAALSIAGFGLATPLLFLASEASIYHEAVWWGVASALCGLVFVQRLLFAGAPGAGDVLGLSLAAGAALLARATFGAPLLAILAYAVARPLWSASRGARPARLALASLPAAAAVAFQLWHNFDRFGSPATFIDFQYLGYLAGDETAWSVLRERGTFSAARIGPALAAYFGPGLESFSGGFPWVRPTRLPQLDLRLYPALFEHFAVSLALTSGWLVVGAMAGLWRGFAGPVPRGWRLAACAFLAQAAIPLAYYIVVWRYAADFLPLLAFGWTHFLRTTAGGRRLRIALAAALAAGCAITLAATVAWIPENRHGVPPGVQDRLTAVFRSVDDGAPASGARP